MFAQSHYVTEKWKDFRKVQIYFTFQHLCFAKPGGYKGEISFLITAQCALTWVLSLLRVPSSRPSIFIPRLTLQYPLSNTAMRALLEGLVQTKCHRRLCVEWEEGEMADVLTSAFTGDVRNTSLEHLKLQTTLERLGIAMPVLLSSSNHNLKKIKQQP
ncbi:hypothetical protein R1flu_029193 [Riccia fluitans]|uniref:Uncharacterized protein n=1 Tax=Riccia fluitans TaxID=41844 RepID=A0ABD1XNV8_9MARC